MKILHLDASVTGEKSISRPLTGAAADRLKVLYPAATYIYRDLIRNPIAHSSAVHRLLAGDAHERTAEQEEELARSNQVLQEFLTTDVLLIGAPMYNYGIPSQLKVWIDLICVPGITFTYGPQGAKGQCGGKRAIVVATRGGRYGADSPTESRDHQERYLGDIFRHLGITDVTMIRAEGVALGPESLAKAIDAAKTKIAQLT